MHAFFVPCFEKARNKQKQTKKKKKKETYLYYLRTEKFFLFKFPI